MQHIRPSNAQLILGVSPIRYGLFVSSSGFKFNSIYVHPIQPKIHSNSDYLPLRTEYVLLNKRLFLVSTTGANIVSHIKLGYFELAIKSLTSIKKYSQRIDELNLNKNLNASLRVKLMLQSQLPCELHSIQLKIFSLFAIFS